MKEILNNIDVLNLAIIALLIFFLQMQKERKLRK